MKYLKINIFTYLQFILIFFFLLIHNSNNCFAQTNTDLGSPFIQNYTPKEYNASTQNWAIVKDNRGIMYFGNSNGVLEYDGTNWRLIKITNNSTVRSLSIDSTGTIYIGAVGEFGYLSPDSIGNMKYNSLITQLDTVDRKFKDVWYIHTYYDKIYFLTYNALYQYNPKHQNETIINKTIAINSPFKIWKPEKSFESLFLANNNLLIKQSEIGLMQIINDSLHFIKGSELFANISIYVMLPFKDKQILIGTPSKGLYIYNPNNKSNKFTKPKKFKEIDIFLIKNSLYDGCILPENLYALSTIRKGLIIINDKGKIIKTIDKQSGLQNNSILYAYNNKQELWLALINGISQVEWESPIRFWNETSGLKGLLMDIIRYQGILFVSTSQGIYYLDENQFKEIEGINSQCWDLLSYSPSDSLNSSKLLVGTSKGVLEIKISKTGKFSAHLLTKDLIVFDLYNSKKSKDIIYLGLKNGIAVIQYKNGELIYQGKIDGITEEVRYIAEDKNNNICLGTVYNGIIKLSEKNNSIKPKYLITRYDTSSGFPKTKYSRVYNYKDDLLFTMDNCIYKFDKSQNSFIPDTSLGKRFTDGSIGIYRFIEDQKGNCWIGANFNKPYTEVLLKQENNIYKSLSLPFKRIPYMEVQAIYPEPNGIVWIGGIEGLFSYNINNKINYNLEYNTLIRKVTIKNDSVIFLGSGSGCSGFQANTNINNFENETNLILSFDNNSIIFNYSAAYFKSEETNLYSYYLDGFDKNWSEWTKNTEKEYTNLSEGNYTFKVKAINIFEKESTIAEYKFEILPPWYREIWAYFLYFVILSLLIFIIVKLNTKRLKAANLQLEKIINERTIEIQSQNEELEKLSIVASKTDNAVLIIDNNGKIEWINEGFTRMTGYTLDEIWTIKGHDFIETSSNPNIKKEFNKCEEQKKSVIYSTKNYTKDNKEIWIQTTLTPILDKNNNIIKYIAIDSDITKIKLAEKEIEKQKNEIECQRDQIAEINMEVKDSILYASRIQSALLTPQELMNKYLSGFFIINKPRDIVSGDFYWIGQRNNKLIIAVADCTGHGVPGAFLSMLGMTYINEIVNIAKTRKEVSLQPNEILDQLREKTIKSLHQKEKEGETNDGMDISLCIIDCKKMELLFSGANNPVYLVRENKLQEIVADKMPIGVYVNDNQPFTTQRVKLIKNDMLYLMSDGYSDQFGGNKGKKFMIWRLKEVLQSNSNLHINEQKTHLINIHKKWKGKLEQVDDILIMGIKI
ncbi:MAG: SpoIIE family protein phosphatase [Bacteroidales bacterium]|nr:SpoIIE family protein phosphatase [Bacteroidales bacterium]